MAVLKIYEPIGTREDEFSYNSLLSFIDTIPEADKEINIRMSCIGGDVDEGIAIYNKLKELQAKYTISAKIEGHCDSIATIIILGAQTRSAYPTNTPLIHHPWVQPDGTPINVDDAKELYENLNNYTLKLKEIYLKELNVTDEQISEMLSNNIPITSEKAQEIGLFTSILEPIKAMAILNINNKKENSMDEKSLVKAIVDGVKEVFAKKEPQAMNLKDKEGKEFSVTRESGDVAVGDEASPDGTYTMEDGTVIVIENGVVASIKKAEEAEAERKAAEEKAAAEAKEKAKQEAVAKVEELTAKLAELEKVNAELSEKIKAADEEKKAKASKTTTFKPQARDLNASSDNKKETYFEKRKKELK